MNVHYLIEADRDGPRVAVHVGAYDYTFTYPASGAPRPHRAVAIGRYQVRHDLNGNLTRTVRTDTSDTGDYVYDEENRLACVHKGQQVPSPSCEEHGTYPAEFVYNHAGVRKRKDAGTSTFYPNQYFTDIGGGESGWYKHVFLAALEQPGKQEGGTTDGIVAGIRVHGDHGATVAHLA